MGAGGGSGGERGGERENRKRKTIMRDKATFQMSLGPESGPRQTWKSTYFVHERQLGRLCSVSVGGERQ